MQADDAMTLENSTPKQNRNEAGRPWKIAHLFHLQPASHRPQYASSEETTRTGQLLELEGLSQLPLEDHCHQPVNSVPTLLATSVLQKCFSASLCFLPVFFLFAFRVSRELMTMSYFCWLTHSTGDVAREGHKGYLSKHRIKCRLVSSTILGELYRSIGTKLWLFFGPGRQNII